MSTHAWAGREETIMTGPYITERGGRTAYELFGEGGRAYLERNAEELAKRLTTAALTSTTTM
jgi:hypothetical protein